MKKLRISEQAQHVLNEIQTENGPLMFLISGGCCDGSAPLCMEQKEFQIGESDVLLGYVEQCPVYISDLLSDHFMSDKSFYLDVAPGRGGGFSLETPYGVRFINRAHY